MAKWDKLITRICNLSKDLRFDELRKVLESYGYEMNTPRSGSSHYTFRKQGCMPITIPKHEPIKKVYVEMVRQIVESEAKNDEDGVLFIDEAYALNKKDANVDFGIEAINTILKYMEDHRGEIMIIFAGYTKEMEEFVAQCSVPFFNGMDHTGHPTQTLCDFVTILEHLPEGKELKDIRLAFVGATGVRETSANDLAKLLPRFGATVVLCEAVDGSDEAGYEGVKAKGVVHWVNARDCVDAEFRYYDYLLLPYDGVHEDFAERMNPESLTVYRGKAERALADARPGDSFQFVRTGYFVRDTKSEGVVFNRVVALKESYKAK